jgi:hypothetical protein
MSQYSVSGIFIWVKALSVANYPAVDQSLGIRMILMKILRIMQTIALSLREVLKDR